MQNPIQMIQAFNQFRKNYTNESAEKKVKELVASGKMSQSQLDMFQRQANEFVNMLNNFTKI